MKNSMSASEERPHVFLIGAQKSGTTSLASILQEHPDICLSKPKETNFFSENFHEGYDWYHRHFTSNSGTICLDGSASYTMTPVRLLDQPSLGPDIPARIFAHSPSACFIYILRNHADRVHSAYWHNVRAGDEHIGLRAVLSEQGEYVASTLYCRQLDHFFRFFPRDRFLILRFEELKRDPVAIADQCRKFFGLEFYDFSNPPAPKNQSFQYTPVGQLIRNTLGTRNNMKSATRIAKAIVPSPWWQSVKGLASKPVPDLSNEDREWLNEFFREDQERLRSEFGISL